MAFTLAEKRAKASGKPAKVVLDSHASHISPAQVTIVHKSNVLSVTDGLFREVIRDEWEHSFKHIGLDEQLVVRPALASGNTYPVGLHGVPPLP